MSIIGYVSCFSKASSRCKHYLVYHLEIPPTSQARSFLFKLDENRWSMRQTSQRIVPIWNATKNSHPLTRTHRHQHVQSSNIYLCCVWMSIQAHMHYTFVTKLLRGGMASVTKYFSFCVTNQDFIYNISNLWFPHLFLHICQRESINTSILMGSRDFSGFFSSVRR